MHPISPESPIRGRLVLPSISPSRASAESVNPLRLSYTGLTDGEKLIQAIEMEDYKEAKRGLENSSALVNYRKPETGQSPLMLAIKYDQKQLVEYMLTVTGIDVNVRDNEGRTALIQVCGKGWMRIAVKLIREYGADVNSRTIHGMTPLMMASKNGYVELVQFLVQEGQAEVNRVDAQGHTAVMHASQEGHLPVVKVLIEKGQADAAMCSPHDKQTATLLAISNDHYEIVKYLADDACKVDADDPAYEDQDAWNLSRLVKAGNISAIQQLLEEQHVDVNTALPDDWTLLGLSISCKHTKLARYLLTRYHDPKNPLDLDARNKKGMTALMLAADNGDFHLLDELLSMVTSKNVNMQDFEGETALMHGVEHYNIVHALVEKGMAQVNAKTSHPQTALGYAIMKSSLDVVRYLIEQAKADVNLANAYKQTPLMLAILAANDASTPHYLIQLPSIDVNAQDLMGRTAFMHALSPHAKWKFDVFELFNNVSVDVNLRDKEETTATSLAIEAASHLVLPSTLRRMKDYWHADFTFAKSDGTTYLHQVCKVEQSDPSAVELILDAGVHVDRTDSDGKTALMFAALHDNVDVVRLLVEEANADPNKVCKEGMTALMYAVNNPQSTVVDYLMECEQVNLTLKSPDGRTAMEMMGTSTNDSFQTLDDYGF